MGGLCGKAGAERRGRAWPGFREAQARWILRCDCPGQIVALPRHALHFDVPGAPLKPLTRCLPAFALLLALSGAGQASAQIDAPTSPDGVWQAVDPVALAGRGVERQIVPRSYRALRLARATFEQLLRDVPIEASLPLRESRARLWLPLPDGGFGEFRIVESPIMEPALAARFPQIRTWLGQGIDDPTATLRFDLTPKGFHAQILSVHGSVYIDPYAKDDSEHYIAYRRRDAARRERPRCEVTGEEIAEGERHLHVHELSPQLGSGATLRTYRLAMAATGEYTQYHGGTVLDGLSAIVTTMNRVNGIYEREVSLRMVLVADNDLIVYTNPATDPYANTSGDLGANQTNITAVIGSANYDIGHLVGTGGGGVAGLGVVCNNSSKARGLTGSSNPVGDPFDVDYVAHEIGHQFGGNHTFNGSGGNCSGANRKASTAYEPGSGITIQAYAGICGTDNLQPNSEDYFHRISLNEILAFTNNAATGGSCGSPTPTGNGIPTVSAPAGFTIPQQTPFELTASGSDPDGDALTYLWEQFDLGAANAAGSLVDNGSRPLFRSFRPQADPSRVFPSWRYILGNANVAPPATPLPGTESPDWFTAELLPGTDRTMNFRVTVRDNRAGGGGTNEAATAVTVSTEAGPFRVTQPNAALDWIAGAEHEVSWDVAGTVDAPVSTSHVRIRLSLDGGRSWPLVLAESVPNAGSATVTLPVDTPSSNQARIRVEAVGNIYFDVSDADFTVLGGNSPPSIDISGALGTRQGGPAASAIVGTVSDLQDAVEDLLLSIEEVPAGLAVWAENEAGDIRLHANAACSLVAPRVGTKAHPVLVRATDLDGASSVAAVNVHVGGNRPPTLGSFADRVLRQGAAGEHAPAQPAADPDANLSSVSVLPATLPGGGALDVSLDGSVQVATTIETEPGLYPVQVTATDACGARESRQFGLEIEAMVLAVLLIENQGGTAVAEGGAGADYAVVLGQVPSGDVVVAIEPDEQLSVVPSSLLFTPDNWYQTQTVSVSAIDDELAEGPHLGIIAHSVSGGGYDGVEVPYLMVAIEDDDVVLADIGVQLDAQPRKAVPGATVAFALSLTNLSSEVDVPVLDLAFEIDPSLLALGWTCTAGAGASCLASGSGPLQHAIALQRDSAVLYEIRVEVPEDAPEGAQWLVSAVAVAALPVVDPVPGNDSAEVLIERLDETLFGTGFEPE
jgi:hypothetical protein